MLKEAWPILLISGSPRNREYPHACLPPVAYKVDVLTRPHVTVLYQVAALLTDALAMFGRQPRTMEGSSGGTVGPTRDRVKGEVTAKGSNRSVRRWEDDKARLVCLGALFEAELSFAA